MIIEILYFPGCPHYLPAVENVRRALEDERVAAEVRHVRVEDGTQAAATGFPGSPSVRVNGMDVEWPAPPGTAGLCCRTYASENGDEGAPSVQLIRSAIRRLDRKDYCREER